MLFKMFFFSINILYLIYYIIFIILYIILFLFSGLICTFIGTSYLDKCHDKAQVLPWLGTGTTLCLFGIAYMFYYITILLVYLHKE